MKRTLLIILLSFICISMTFAQERPESLSAEWALSEIQQIEVYLERFDREPLEGEHAKLYAVATKSWDTFKNLCKQEEFKAAAYFYKENLQDFWVYLYNTSAQFYFVRYIIKHLVFQFMPWDEAYALFKSDLELNLVMTEVVIEMAKEKAGYVPPHYADLTYEMIGLYLEGEEWDLARETIDHYVVALQLLLDFSDLSASVSKAYVQSIVFRRKGEISEAKKVLQHGLNMLANVKEGTDTPENIQGFKDLLRGELEQLEGM